MLQFFSNGDLPGGVVGPYASSDVTSFLEIWQAAQQIEATCLLRHQSPGWAAEGKLIPNIGLRSIKMKVSSVCTGIDSHQGEEKLWECFCGLQTLSRIGASRKENRY